MRKLAFIFATTLILLALAGCGSRQDNEPTVEATEESTPEQATVTVEAPAETPTPKPGSYPPPATPTPLGAYPGFTPAPTYDPYPGGLATILHPMGIQCEEPTMPDLSVAISSLENAGITVVAAEEVALNVCSACGCDTSEHFRVQINAEDLDVALASGWQRQ